MSDAIALEDVHFRYGGTAVLRGLSLSLSAGEVMAVLGPSGCGKTTVLRLILGFISPDAGVVRIEGKPVSKDGAFLCSPEERNLGMVFQDLALWPHLSVAGNLSFGLEARRVSRAERRERVERMLDRVGLGGMQARYPGELSGGERQRVAIARALVLEPQAVLLDEPLANLDAARKRDLLAVFRELLTERGTTAMYVTHDLREAASIGDRIAVLEEGKVVQVGSLAELRHHPGNRFVEALVADLDWSGTSEE